jgi:hypothetical protein
MNSREQQRTTKNNKEQQRTNTKTNIIDIRGNPCQMTRSIP